MIAILLAIGVSFILGCVTMGLLVAASRKDDMRDAFYREEADR